MLLICLTVVLSCQTSSFNPGYDYQDRILSAAEDFFVCLKKGDYGGAWDLLSEESRETIIGEVYRASRDAGIDMNKKDISRDFNSSGIMFNRYWSAFSSNFNPDTVLEERVWEFEKTGSDRAIIQLKGKGLTRLRMYKESGFWKVGLTETFRARRGGIITFLRALFTH